MGSAFRAPNIAVLASIGVHEGAFRFEIGNSALKPERSFYGDFSLGLHNKIIDADWSVFYNQINQYIFSRQQASETTTVGGTVYPVFRFVQDNALLTGSEISLTIHPTHWIHLENSFAYTRGANQNTHTALPFIPAGTLRNELKFEPQITGLTGSFFSVELESVFAQNRIDSFETVTRGYGLLSASLGTNIAVRKTDIHLHISGSNLLNKKYYDHLSRLKPGRLDESNPGIGFYNPGRGITVGIYVPFKLKSAN